MVWDRMTNPYSIMILTGAGISAESGIKTFRDSGGLWEQHRVEDVATPEAFERDPDLVQRFYDERRSSIQATQPNAAHFALAQLERVWPGYITIVTQNIDDLHERAGSKNVIHMHGELLRAWCTSCDTRVSWLSSLVDKPSCPNCTSPSLRPDVVWFGEYPYHTEVIQTVLKNASVFVSIGTSGSVYPAAGFVETARSLSKPTLELNLEPSIGSMRFHENRFGLASETVATWVNELIG